MQVKKEQIGLQIQISNEKVLEGFVESAFGVTKEGDFDYCYP